MEKLKEVIIIFALAFVIAHVIGAVVRSQEVLVFENPPLTLHAEASNGEVPVEEEEWLQGTFTAFTASVDETDSNPFEMASGNTVYQGAIACPTKYAFGTKIEIENIGIFICEDRKAERFREINHFDIYHKTKKEAFIWGVRNLRFKAL